MSFNVYRVEYIGVPNHEAIFVETHESGPGNGHLYHVVGSIAEGMRYDQKPAKKPEESINYADVKTFIGTVRVANYASVDTVCKTIPPPKKQFQGPRRLYPREPLRRCGEWATEAIQALKDEGVLE